MAGIRKRRIEADYLKVSENFEFLVLLEINRYYCYNDINYLIASKN